MVVAEAVTGQAIRAASTAPSTADAERFRSLVDAQYDFVWRSLRRLGVAEEGVDDAAQQVFLVLSKKIADLAPGCERTFLFRTAMGVAANARRSARLRGRETPDAEKIAGCTDETLTPEELVRMKQARQVLDQILDAMDPDYRSVFVLAELEGMTAPAIGELLEIPTGTATSRLRRAREMFQEAVGRFHARQRFEASSTSGGM
jgi:RNA polymerase sigma-70 factor, ECF subfamily